MVEEIEIDKNKKKQPASKTQQQSKPQVYLAIHNRRVTNAGYESALPSEITMCFVNQLCHRAKGAILRNSTIIIHSIRIYAQYECAKEKINVFPENRNLEKEQTLITRISLVPGQHRLSCVNTLHFSTCKVKSKNESILVR